ncbi:tetratricopeptide (TPR) repeat protein [Arcicella aurantiaca]|uniref:Tetratricopeptide (TPR) repeat protein n=1 Tax=Arcicella aurantiaca TaxID=591202 RepID=A0A316ESN3_9BACT|nr:tetratricopeptide repeat protein [Arcicella aurantiaca]PWK26160.1 tetratricopeptide (TPR) repeat protein [Arcicella aurantiaca]
MSKNNKPQKKSNISQVTVNQTVKNESGSSKTSFSYGKWLAIGALIITLFVAFSGGFDNQFVDWDDHVYIENDYLVTEPKGHFGEAFKSHVALNYHPLTIVSMMINSSVSGAENPKAFIVTNFFIHLLNTLMVFWLMMLLTKRRLMASFFAALLFAIHPMRVESVTWISERKDVLYGFFFIAGCISYLYYLDSEKKNKYLIISLILFVLSCLSKAQAVVLPIVFFLFDYWRDRKIDTKAILEKVPFLVFSLLFGLIATNIQSGGDFHGTIHIIGEQRSALSLKVFSMMDRIQYAGYGFVMYFYHLFVPINLCTFYPYEPDGANKLYSTGIVFSLIIVGLTIFSARKSKLFLFGIGFFAVTVALVLQFISVGAAIMADRYTYIPYIGLFFVLAMLLDQLAEKNQRLKQVVWVGAFAFVAFCLFQTRKQVETWQNTGTLFGQIIKLFPKDYRAYYTYGKYVGEKEGKLEESIEANKKAIELGYKDDAGPWENLGTAYGIKGDTQKALEYFSEAIKRGASSGETYMNRGMAYFNLNQPAKAIPDFEKSLTMKNDKIVMSRGLLATSYLASGNATKALENFNQVIDKEGSQDPVHFYNRGLAKQTLGDRVGAIADFQKTLTMQPNYEAAKKSLASLL